MEVAHKPRTVTISYQSRLCCFEPLLMRVQHILFILLVWLIRAGLTELILYFLYHLSLSLIVLSTNMLRL